MMFTQRLLVAFVVIALVTSAWANDTLVTLAGGGLIPLKPSTIAMVSEDLQVSVREIHVTYVFRNDSDQATDATVAFPMPELNGAMIANSPIEFPAASPTNFMNFRVLVAGQPVMPKTEIRAFYKGHDISARLRSLRLPLSVLDRARLDVAIQTLTVDQRRQLENGLVDRVEDKDPRTQSIVTHYWPYWHTSIQYYWSQHFPARSEVEVKHVYRPVVGGSYITKEADMDNEYGKDYCSNAETLRQIRTAQQRSPTGVDPVLLERQVHYILTTANNWRGPIRHFHPTVTTDPGDILTTCMEGLKPGGPGRFELVRSDFRPVRELKVLILQPNKR